nr:MAG TPA: hypothetical protein [Caudoviricetes sp.]
MCLNSTITLCCLFWNNVCSRFVWEYIYYFTVFLSFSQIGIYNLISKLSKLVYLLVNF